MAIIQHTCLERFLKYVTYDTQSSEDSTSFPSTEKQKLLGQELAKELLAIGLRDSRMDEWGYVTATLPANATHDVPVIGLIAHMDTSPDVSGQGIKAVMHRNYQGGDIALPSGVVIRAQENPALQQQIGNDLITSSGDTLLGADNKAGIAEIFDALYHLVRHPEIKHGLIRVAITPDEEVGRGTEHFDVMQFGAQYAYTIDGETLGEVEDETFSADSVVIQIQGVNVHPGYAKNKMVNALKIAAELVDRLPKGTLSPETTELREGYVHPHALNASVEEATLKFLIRDFTVEGLMEKESFIEKLMQETAARHARAKLTMRVEESYRNMKYKLDEAPQVVAHALEAVRRVGLEPKKHMIRGGTDGSKLSYQGLPTPNIFTGGHNFHSRQEWISVQDMYKAVEVIVALVQNWEEKSRA